MMPVLHDGYIIVVDMSQTNRLKLYGHIIVGPKKNKDSSCRDCNDSMGLRF